jgi:hypothetical protein
VLGIEFDLTRLAHRLSQPWVTGWKSSTAWSRVRRNVATNREFAAVFGHLIWAAQVQGWALAEWPSTLSFVSRVGTRTQESDCWDASCDVPASVRRELGGAIARAQLGEWVLETPVPRSGVQLWSDASSREWAALSERGGRLVSGVQGVFSAGSSRLIFGQEAFAHAEGLMTLPIPPGRVPSLIDNRGVVGAFRRGHCKAYGVNKIIAKCRRFASSRGLRPTYYWVPTELELADPFTRGRVLPPEGSQLYAPVDLSGSVHCKGQDYDHSSVPVTKLNSGLRPRALDSSVYLATFPGRACQLRR